jgi:carboxypeptidase C (cathepsin A)
VLNWQGIDFHPGNDLSSAVYLPAYAAAAWYHHRIAPELQAKSIEEVQKEAETYAMTDYWLALAKGNALTPEEQTKTAQTLARFTGLKEEFIVRHHLRVPAGQFMDELLKFDNHAIGRFDSRLTGLFNEPDGSDYDPSFTTMRGVFTASINEYIRSELKFETELPYQSLADVSPWNFSTAENRYLDVADSLSRAMTKNPGLKVWVLTGYYDLAVSYFTTEYTLRHMMLEPELQPNLHFSKYPSGHMIYTDTTQLKPLKDDFHAFLQEAVKPRAAK